jgi:hypothetical protein
VVNALLSPIILSQVRLFSVQKEPLMRHEIKWDSIKIKFRFFKKATQFETILHLI